MPTKPKRRRKMTRPIPRRRRKTAQVKIVFVDDNDEYKNRSFAHILSQSAVLISTSVINHGFYVLIMHVRLECKRFFIVNKAIVA